MQLSLLSRARGSVGYSTSSSSASSSSSSSSPRVCRIAPRATKQSCRNGKRLAFQKYSLGRQFWESSTRVAASKGKEETDVEDDKLLALDSRARVKIVKEADLDVKGDDVDSEMVEMAREVVGLLRFLQEARDLNVEEVRLTLAIEDPRDRERRQMMGIEDESGASRDEIAEAVVECASGEIPSDKIVLQALLNDLRSWKADVVSLNDNTDSNKDKESYEATVDEGFTADTEFELPKWMGYSAVYVISAVPIFIGLGVVWILWTTSLRG